MTYDFDEPVVRRGTDCMKWDEPLSADALGAAAADGREMIPLWVADMDFKAAPCIRQALARRLAHGVFGYTLVADSYYEAVIGWFARRHQWNIRREWIQYTTGVVPAISAVLKALTLPGERVVVMTPVYNCFFSSIRNSGCEMLASPLVATAAEPDAAPDTGVMTYTVDWADFEAKCADEKATVFLLCNPHNPAGRVWTRHELLRMADICRRHGVRIVSDEIHCELTMPGHAYTPIGTLAAESLTGEDVTCRQLEADTAHRPMAGQGDGSVEGLGCFGQAPITLCSPSKAFNTAGLQIANVICADAETRRRIDRAININEICDVNPFGPVALEAAYREGEPWLDALNDYVWQNYRLLCRWASERMPQWRVFRLEGTYLAWVDVSASGLTSDELALRLQRDARVWVASGTGYGAAGEGYIRLNLATQRRRLAEALNRMAEALSC